MMRRAPVAYLQQLETEYVLERQAGQRGLLTQHAVSQRALEPFGRRVVTR